MAIILIHGKKRSGKNHFGAELQRQLEARGVASEIMAFADPVKDILAQTFSVSLEELDNLKNHEAEICSGEDYLTDFRVAMQRFATEAMRKYFGETVWVDLMETRIRASKAQVVIIPDFRFLSEYFHGATTINIINAAADSTDEHRSENELRDFSFGHIVHNTGLPDSEHSVRTFLETLELPL